MKNELTRGNWADITNHLHAAEVTKNYSCSVWIDGRMVHMRGQDAIDYLIFMAEDGTEINGMN